MVEQQITLAEYHGVLNDETAWELEAVVETRRMERSSATAERIKSLIDSRPA